MNRMDFRAVPPQKNPLSSRMSGAQNVEARQGEFLPQLSANMIPETSMRRSSLITEILTGSEFRFRARPHAASGVGSMRPRRRPHWTLVVGALLMACGCQSSTSLSRFSPKTKSEDISQDQKKSVLSILGKKTEKDEAGLPNPSNSKSEGGSSEALLDKGENALAAYYKDSSPTHLTEAHQCYEQVLAESPGNTDAHHGLAIVCDLQKNFASAEMHYRAALEKDPNNGRILGDLGYSYLLQNKLSDSEKTLVQATKIDPANTQAFKNLGYVYAKQGNYNQAEATFRRAMNDVEVRQELAQLFPNGRPDMAKPGEQGKLPWQNNKAITTNEFATQMADARKQSLADLKARQKLLDDSSAPTLTLEQMKEQLHLLAQERDDAVRLAESRAQQSNNTPLVLGAPAGQNPMENRGYNNPGQGGYPYAAPNQFAGTQSGGPGQFPSPNGPRYQRPGEAQVNSGVAPGMATTGQPPMNMSGGRPVANTFYPNGAPQPGMQNRSDIEQASGGYGDPRSNEHALHRTNGGVDPRTGMPMNGGIQQVDGRGPLLVPNTYGNPPQGGNQYNSPDAANSAPPANQQGSYEDAKRRAALAGMGGPEMMFNVPAVNVPQIDGGNRLSPGTGSTWNGGQYPQPTRMLPMDAAPHDLDALSKLPSEQMTVQPNNTGMLNAPTGRSFSNPNFEQPLNPQIPLDSPLGNQGTNFQDQAYPGQGSRRQPSENGYSPYEASTNSDPRNGVNASLQQYGQSMQYNSAQDNQNAWGRVLTPGAYTPEQPQVQNPSQLMNSGWNQQQLSPRITTPPPYSSRNSQSSNDPYSQNGGYGNSSESTQQRGYSDDSGYSQGQSYSSEPAPIYSSGARVPASYNNGNTTRASGPYGQGYNGPRITPAGR